MHTYPPSLVVTFLHGTLATRHSLPLSARQDWRSGVFALLDTALHRDDAVNADAIGDGIDEDAFGTLENKAGCYREFTDGLTWRPVDVCWPDSNSGRNALVVEFAQEAKRNGVTVIALTSVPHSTAVPPTPGLPRLPDIADYGTGRGVLRPQPYIPS